MNKILLSDKCKGYKFWCRVSSWTNKPINLIIITECAKVNVPDIGNEFFLIYKHVPGS